MKRLVFLFIFSTALGAETIWHKSVLEGFAVAKKNGTPILIDLYADWCDYCKVLEKDIFPTPAVSSFLGKFTNIRINGEEYPNLMERYNVKGFPTILFLDKNGYYLTKLTGLPDEQMVLSKLQHVYSNRNIEDSLLFELKKNPAGANPNLQLGMYYYQAAELEKSVHFFKKTIQAIDNRAELKMEAQYHLALVYMDMEKYSEAIKEWNTYLKTYGREGDIFSAYYFRGISYANRGDKKLAKEDWLKASSMTNDPAKKKDLAGLMNQLSGSN